MLLRLGHGLAVLLAIGLLACAPGPGNSGDDDDDDTAGDVDGSPGGDQPDATEFPDAAACASASKQAEEVLAPVDIIWAVDSSGSMDDEAAAVQNALNDCSALIAASGIDYRVILIGDAGDMSVPPPLGGSAEFLHVDQTVNSTDAFERIHGAYSAYAAFRRPNAVVHLVVVTDDESNWSHGTFNTNLAALPAPGIPADYTLHSICSEETVIFVPPPPLPPINGPCSGGLGAGGAADIGQTYIDATAATGGVWASICSTNWDPIFMAVAEAVAVGIALPCTYDIPTPPEGETLDPNAVNFIYTPSGGGSPQTIPRVDGPDACGSGAGWYYDDQVHPTPIMVCDTTCDALTADADGEVDIQFGCATVVL
jgi:hypothetical protein